MDNTEQVQLIWTYVDGKDILIDSMNTFGAEETQTGIERQKEKQTGILMDEYVERQINKQTDRQIDKQVEKHIDRYMRIEICPDR